MNVSLYIKQVLELYKSILSSSSTSDVFENFQLIKDIASSVDIIKVFIFHIDSYVDVYDVRDIEYDDKGDKFILPFGSGEIDRSELLLVAVPTVGFRSIDPYKGGDVVEYIRNTLLSINPELSPVVGEGISSAEEHIITLVSEFYAYLIDQIQYVSSQFFPDTASGKFLTQLAYIAGVHPSPPSSDRGKALMIPSLPDSFFSQLYSNIADPILSSLRQYLLNYFRFGDIVNGITYNVNPSDYPSVINLASLITSFIEQTFASKNEFLITVKVYSGDFSYDLRFESESTFPKIERNTDEIYHVELEFICKIKVTPGSINPVQFTVTDGTNSQTFTFNSPPPLTGSINLEMVSYSYKIDPAFFVNVFGKRDQVFSFSVDGFYIATLPPIDFSTIKVDPQTVINPYSPYFITATNGYIIPVWDPTSMKSRVKIVTYSPTNIKITAEVLEPLRKETVTLSMKAQEYRGSFQYSYSYPFLQTYFDFYRLAQFLGIQGNFIDPKTLGSTFSQNVFLTGTFDENTFVSADIRIFSIEKGYSGDRIEKLRSQEPKDLGILRETNIRNTLERFLPVITSVDVVAEVISNPLPLP